jgi:hypothetical protein
LTGRHERDRAGLALDAGQAERDIAISTGHGDTRMVAYYDRGRDNISRTPSGPRSSKPPASTWAITASDTSSVTAALGSGLGIGVGSVVIVI